MRRSLIAKFAWPLSVVTLLAWTAFQFPAAAAPADSIVDHPDKLKFEKLNYKPPRPADYRHTLKSGATAYVAENHEVPTFELTILVRTGSMYQPVAKAGVAGMTAHLMRNGGVEGMTAAEFDEKLAMLAGEISVRIGPSRGSVHLFCLSKDADAALGLLGKMLRAPAFDDKALERYRTDVLSELEQRNASTAAIEAREWQFLLYGEDHPSSTPYRRTKASIESIGRVPQRRTTLYRPAPTIRVVGGTP